MKIWVYTISFNEALLMPFFLRHYSNIADKIVVWDEHSTDGTREIVKACPKAELRDWPYTGLNDEYFLNAVNNWYKGARGRADWVMWPDVDEILHHPKPRWFLENCRDDAVVATGYAMIGNGVSPLQGFTGQIYEKWRTGVPQQNYDKFIIWRPGIEITHKIGRHGVPAAEGAKLCRESGWKLLHYHFFSPDYTRQRNQRNYARAVNKKYAWNYAPGETSRGTEAWVKQMIDTSQLVTVV